MRDAVEVVGTGFTALDRVYADGRLAGEELGGSCGNVLLSLAYLQRRVAPLLSLGLDEVGQYLKGEFSRAGAVTDFIVQSAHVQSPILAEILETATGRHTFSAVSLETNLRFPRYRPIEQEVAASARNVIAHCSVFYADRLSVSIVESMELAAGMGAVVFFEPSAIEDEQLFGRALRVSNIVKCASDRLDRWSVHPDAETFTIVTHGSSGLEARHRDRAVWCDAIEAPAVVDTCGSGDMVSVGIIDSILRRGRSQSSDFGQLLDGVRSGQRLAAVNCGYMGARGVFRAVGTDRVRQLLAQ